MKERVLRRSVLRQLQDGAHGLLPLQIGEDCGAFSADGAEVVVCATETQTADTALFGKRTNIQMTGTAIPDMSVKVQTAEEESVTVRTDWGLALGRAVNNLTCGGAKASGVLTSVVLPRVANAESGLKEIMRQIRARCDSLGLMLLGGDTRTSDTVNAPVLTVTAVGTCRKGSLMASKDACAGDDLIVTKWVGLYGTALLAKARKRALLARFPFDLVETAAAFDRMHMVTEEARIARDCGAHAMHDVTEGGVFGAMWQFADAAGLGLDVDLKKLPIRQETVEVCNALDVNPYLLVSDGCLLIAAKCGQALLEALHRAGIPAVIAGKFTDGNDRVVRNAEESRYLEPVCGDAIREAMKTDTI